MENFKIEDARLEDAEVLDNIQKACWLEIYPNPDFGITREDILAGSWNNPKRVANKKEEISQMNLGKIHVWIVRDNGKEVVGFCTAHKLDSRGYIERMYILPEFHGKGLGQALIQKAFQWLGPVDIKLEVVSYNIHAIGFYKKMGFKESRREIPTGYYSGELTNGKEIPRIEMVKLKA